MELINGCMYCGTLIVISFAELNFHPQYINSRTADNAFRDMWGIPNWISHFHCISSEKSLLYE
jgi:hypothetical protein